MWHVKLGISRSHPVTAQQLGARARRPRLRTLRTTKHPNGRSTTRPTGVTRRAPASPQWFLTDPPGAEETRDPVTWISQRLSPTSARTERQQSRTGSAHLPPEDTTPRRTHIILGLVSVPHLIALFARTCVRVAQVKLDSDVLHTCAPSLKSSHVSQIALRHVWPISIILFHATADDTEHTAADWNQENPCATPPGGMLFG